VFPLLSAHPLLTALFYKHLPKSQNTLINAHSFCLTVIQAKWIDFCERMAQITSTG